MLIDWFTLVAQLVNFLILVWLLKRFLYQPVLKALDEREKKIAAELQSAAAVQEEADRKLSEWKRKNEEFEKERTGMMLASVKEAAEKKRSLLDDARKEYDALRLRLHESVRNEQKNMQGEFISRISSEVFSLAQQVLQELAGETLEERVVTVFCEQMRNTARNEIAEMATFVHDSSAAALIRTAFPLSPEQRERLKEAIKVLFRHDVALTFETADNLFSGIELIVNDHTISWNIRAYLDSLEKTVGTLLDGNMGAGEKSHDR
jgi:F-type H+-transporting ATPase subunit b